MKRLTPEGAKRIADAQRRQKILRIRDKTGLPEQEVRRKVELGYSFCGVHGWCPLPRCPGCKRDDSKRRRVKARKSQRPSVTGGTIPPWIWPLAVEIAYKTGVRPDDVLPKLEIGMGWCEAHGWKPWRPCPSCTATSESSSKAKAALTKLAAISPDLSKRVTTADRLDKQQLSLPFGKRAKR